MDLLPIEFELEDRFDNVCLVLSAKAALAWFGIVKRKLSDWFMVSLSLFVPLYFIDFLHEQNALQ